MEFPRHLYKYRHFDNRNLHIRVLTDNEIFFASPAKFNDPFDCRISLDYAGTREETVRNWNDRIANLQFPLPRGLEGLNPEELYDRGFFTSPQLLQVAKQFTKNFGAKAFGIFSLSANHWNILMWSHYSSSHSGFVVGFDSAQLTDYCHSSAFGGGPIVALDVVRYSRLMPQLNAYRHDRNERFEGQFLTKAVDWQYEEEYRMLMQNSPNTPATLPAKAIKTVHLGCQIDPSHRDRIIEVLKARGDQLQLFQAKTSDTMFGLEFEQIRY